MLWDWSGSMGKEGRGKRGGEREVGKEGWGKRGGGIQMSDYNTKPSKFYSGCSLHAVFSLVYFYLNCW